MKPQKTKSKEEDATNDTTVVVNKHKVVLSNREKLYWPEDNITKGDMLDYYDAVADYILPYLENRPLSLKRNPNGMLDEGFYQKMPATRHPNG